MMEYHEKILTLQIWCVCVCVRVCVHLCLSDFWKIAGLSTLSSVQFSSGQSLSRVRLSATP